MPKPRFRLYLALSLDGMIADAEGGVHWLEPFNTEELDFAGFMAGIGTIVMGRTTYDQALTFGEWPYPGKRVVVMTSRPFTPTTPDTEVWGGSVEALADKLMAETEGDVWVLGGAALGRSFLNAGRLDTLELYWIPIVLGGGIPLFVEGTAPARLAPSHVHRYGNGIVRIDYDVARG
ncbi:MAG TPA: dihydrofolate reductase family protein [Microvirga sp.]|jgi:dihydrofolate reductase